MGPGEKFEIECYEYLKKNHQTEKVTFVREGGMDATKSDIRVLKGGKEAFYMEAKDEAAHSGQFVVLADAVNKTFRFSPRNKSKSNEITDLIIQHMNRDFPGLSKAGTAGKALDIDKKLFLDWIVEHYKQKNVKYVISKADRFVIFPLNKFGQYFDVSANYRIKKSGSREPAKKEIEAVQQVIKNQCSATVFRQVGKKLIAELTAPVARDRFVLGNHTFYLAHRDANAYEVRKLSNTRNMNVLFQIRLIKTQAAEDLAAFQASLRD